MSTRARSLWYVAPGAAELRESPLEAPGPETLRVGARFGALSRGTEALVYRREIPESEWQRMRAPFQQGELPGPVSYGYISVGEVEAGDPSRVGESVFCLHPHHDRYLIPADAAIALPPKLPPERAVLAANQETALNAIWDAELLPGHRVRVIGAGVVGLLLARFAARIPGVEVELLDRNPARREIAELMGLRFAEPDQSGSGFDRVFECSGSPAALPVALSSVRTEGRVMVVSWYGNATVPLPLGADFHARRISLVSSQVGRVSPAMGHLNHGERLAVALRTLDDPVLDHLITDEVSFERLPDALETSLSADYPGICTRIVY